MDKKRKGDDEEDGDADDKRIGMMMSMGATGMMMMRMNMMIRIDD